MEQNPNVHDFDNLSFFYNIIRSKIAEAQNDLRKVELYKNTPAHLSLRRLNDIAHTHDEQSDFITMVYKKCAVWQKLQLTSSQLSKVNTLNTLTQNLEDTVYHILFLAEQLKRKKDLPIEEGKEAGIHNTQH